MPPQDIYIKWKVAGYGWPGRTANAVLTRWDEGSTPLPSALLWADFAEICFADLGEVGLRLFEMRFHLFTRVMLLGEQAASKPAA